MLFYAWPPLFKIKVETSKKSQVGSRCSRKGRSSWTLWQESTTVSKSGASDLGGGPCSHFEELGALLIFLLQYLYLKFSLIGQDDWNQTESARVLLSLSHLLRSPCPTLTAKFQFLNHLLLLLCPLHGCHLRSVSLPQVSASLSTPPLPQLI